MPLRRIPSGQAEKAAAPATPGLPAAGATGPMTSPQPTDQPPAASPGKIRTWWHPLLASLLRWQLGGHYHLEEEVPVGQKPLQIDILLLEKEQGELPAGARQVLAGLVEHLGELTLL